MKNKSRTKITNKKSFFLKLKYLLYTGRYNKPAGAFLLMFPCFSGLAYNTNFSIISIKYFILFLIGSFVMRGAGCTINDIIDIDIDQKVARTRNRPLASGNISKKEAFYFLLSQLVVGFLVVINFDFKLILLSFSIIPLVILYPFFKRITFFPQVVLGIVFNWGILLGYICNNNDFNIGIIYLYLSGIFLTIGYDTIYGYQDIKDDIKIGVKSLSIKTKKFPKISIGIIYISSYFFLVMSLIFKKSLGLETYIFLLLIFLHMFIQIKKVNISKNVNLIKIFNSNVYLVAIIFFCVLTHNHL